MRFCNTPSVTGKSFHDEESLYTQSGCSWIDTDYGSCFALHCGNCIVKNEYAEVDNGKEL